jgi:acyl-CoA-binding protein
VVRPEVYYQLNGLSQQARFGDISSERPVWAETGGIDHDGRARWDGWSALKGVGKEDARLRFVRLYFEFAPSALYADTRGVSA